jgi:hypothetical protein
MSPIEPREAIMSIRIFGLVLVFLLGCESAAEKELREKLPGLAQKVSSNLELAMKGDESQSITWKEMFDTCEKTVKALEDTKIEIKSVSPGVEYAPRAELLVYIDLSIDVVRQKNSIYRSMFAVSNALDRAKRNSGTSEYEIKARLEALEEAGEEMKKTEAGATKLETLYADALTKEGSLAALFTEKKMPLERIFERYQESNRKFIEGNKASPK